jgi:hypothetical protein
MRFLCLIHLDEREMANLPHAEMNDLNVREAIAIASRFPSAPLATIEVWPTRELFVD